MEWKYIQLSWNELKSIEMAGNEEGKDVEVDVGRKADAPVDRLMNINWLLCSLSVNVACNCCEMTGERVQVSAELTLIVNCELWIVNCELWIVVWWEQEAESWVWAPIWMASATAGVRHSRAIWSAICASHRQRGSS